MWFSPLLVFAPFSMLSFVVLELPGGNVNPNERGVQMPCHRTQYHTSEKGCGRRECLPVNGRLLRLRYI